MYSDQSFNNSSWHPTMYAINHPVEAGCPQVTSNRAVYINRNFATKVLVNPNFKGNIHINPHVHINPNISSTLLLKSQNVYVNLSMFRPPLPPPEPELIKPPLPIEQPVPTKHTEQSNPIRVSRFSKINKVSVQQTDAWSYKNCATRTKFSPFTKINNAISTRNINSKYKIVHSNKITDNKKVYDTVTRRISLTHNKFKLDNRVTPTKVKAKMSVKAYLMNLDPQRQIIKKTRYKYTRSIKQPVIVRKSPKIVKIKGNTYRFSASRNVLHKLTCSTKFVRNKVKRVVISGVPFVQKDSKTFVRQYANNLVKISSKVLKKDNNPCTIYRKTGQCRAHRAGKCIKQHNPRQISICIRFLQGACHNKNCLLSHIISPEKMATCKYFLEGRCHNETCQYLHVKLSKNADICKEFLQGYCTLGRQCMKRHQLLCPAFEGSGVCRKRKCPYPHGDVVRQYTDKVVNKIARSTERVARKTKEKLEPEAPLRYYREEVVKEPGVSDVDSDKSEPGLLGRPKLGELPSFIALED